MMGIKAKQTLNKINQWKVCSDVDAFLFSVSKRRIHFVHFHSINYHLCFNIIYMASKNTPNTLMRTTFCSFNFISFNILGLFIFAAVVDVFDDSTFISTYHFTFYFLNLLIYLSTVSDVTDQDKNKLFFSFIFRMIET